MKFNLPPIAPDDHETRQRLARYMLHPPVALDRLRYQPETAQVVYYARNHDRSGAPDASAAHIIPALDFLAALCTHIPDAGQQLVRYYVTNRFMWSCAAEGP